MSTQNKLVKFLRALSKDERQTIKWGLEYRNLQQIVNESHFTLTLYPKPSIIIVLEKNEDSVTLTFTRKKIGKNEFIVVKDMKEIQYSKSLEDDVVLQIARSIVYEDVIKYSTILLILGDTVHAYEKDKNLGGFLGQEDFIPDHQMVGLIKGCENRQVKKGDLILKF